MAQPQNLNQLNHLILLNTDAEAAFRTAAANVRNSQLESLFGNYADQHARFHAELKSEMTRLGGNVSNSGTLGGSLHRGWMDVKALLSGHSATAMLTSCQSGEESAEIAYADAADAYPSGQTHTLVQKQWKEITAFRTRLTRLAGEMKDGADFQKNE